MTSWKLVEAIPEAVPAEVKSSNKVSHSGSFGQRGQGGRGRSNNKNRSSFNGRGRGRDGRDGSGSMYQEYYQLTQTDRNYLAYLAVQQIELLFNPDNLCMDTYIRSFMDEAGFLPVAVTLNYPNVASVCAVYVDILNRLQESSPTSILEVDMINETIRLKNGWEMWLMPNGYGGLGQPRHIKHYNNNSAFYQGNMDAQSYTVDYSTGFPNADEISPVQQEDN